MESVEPAIGLSCAIFLQAPAQQQFITVSRRPDRLAVFTFALRYHDTLISARTFCVPVHRGIGFGDGSPPRAEDLDGLKKVRKAVTALEAKSLSKETNRKRIMVSSRGIMNYIATQIVNTNIAKLSNTFNLSINIQGLHLPDGQRCRHCSASRSRSHNNVLRT